MFTLTYGEMRSPQFQEALKAISDMKGLPDHVAYTVAKILRSLRTEEETLGGLFQKMADEFLMRTEDGKPVEVKGQPGAFMIAPDKLADWNSRNLEFMKTEVKILQPRVPLKAVASAVSPAMILALGDLLSFGPEVA